MNAQAVYIRAARCRDFTVFRRYFSIIAFTPAMLAFPAFAIESGSVPAHWNEGAPDCTAYRGPPLEVHAYNSNTYILRESLCRTFEAPFMYLLVGSGRALLIDTGDVADPKQMPLAETVMHLVPQGVWLTVAHSHRHLDHRAADAQFARLAGVTVVGYDLENVKRFWHFDRWPEGSATLDLGGRMVDVLPAPGHNETHLVFYDRQTGIVFSGDFMMPARLLIDDEAAERATAARVAAFVKDRPVAAVLGGHIEEDANGKLFEWESQYHPHEHALAMTKADLVVLPSAYTGFNGFYSTVGKFTFSDSMRILYAAAAAIVLVLAAMLALLIRFLRRRRRKAHA